MSATVTGPPAVAEGAEVNRSAPRRRRTALRRVGPPLVFLVVLVVAWDLLVRYGVVSDYILPLPGDILVAFGDLAWSVALWEHAAVTTYETVAGFVLGSGGAFLLAVLCALSPLIRTTIYPYMIALQVTPRIAITPIIIAWLGFGPNPKIVLAATICFFPVFLNTLTGMLSVDAEQREMFRSLRASKWQTFRQLLLPSSLPITFAGLKTAMTLALIGAIVGEFVSAQEGLGMLVQRYTSQLNMSAAFAVLIFLTLLGLLLYLVMEILDRVFVFWSHDRQLVARTRRLRARHDRAASTQESS